MTGPPVERGSAPEAVSLSVIIPTWNGGDRFRACLEGIAAQEGVGLREVIVLDSGSTDGTVERARERGARVLPVDRSGFNHGAVRHRGAVEATGQILVFTVQDARPADTGWLRGLVEPLLAGAGGATSRILPPPDAPPLARRTVLASPMAGSEPFEADPEKRPLHTLAPEELRWFARFDNVSSAVPAEVYRRVPFRPRAMSEDLQWALDALGAGFRLVFNPRSVVYHAHVYTPVGAYRRYRRDAQALREILGYVVRPRPWDVLKGFLHEVIADWRYLACAGAGPFLRYALYAPWLRAYQAVGQWRGCR